MLFVEDRVLHTGDLFFNRRYPNIDLEAGGSVQQWAETLDRVLALGFDKVIPGHGPVTDRTGLLEFQRFIAELAEFASESAAAGKSLEEDPVCRRSRARWSFRRRCRSPFCSNSIATS